MRERERIDWIKLCRKKWNYRCCLYINILFFHLDSFFWTLPFRIHIIFVQRVRLLITNSLFICCLIIIKNHNNNFSLVFRILKYIGPPHYTPPQKRTNYPNIIIYNQYSVVFASRNDQQSPNGSDICFYSAMLVFFFVFLFGWIELRFRAKALNWIFFLFENDPCACMCNVQLRPKNRTILNSEFFLQYQTRVKEKERKKNENNSTETIMS